MNYKNILKKALVVLFLIIASIFFYFLGSAYRGYKFYNSIYRLNYDRVFSLIKNSKPECTKLSECKLREGDIVMRRYVTQFNQIYDTLLNPYLTHTGYYLGKDQLFEAFGNIPDIKNQITISRFSGSDWLDQDMKNFIVARPKIINESIRSASQKLRDVANDPQYVFGILDEKAKTASCSDIILKTLVDNGIVSLSEPLPKLISPDYLLWVIYNNSEKFDFIGYDINPK